RRHTRFSRDWSSDVCSSDLGFVDIDGDEMLTHHDLLMLVRGLRDKIEASYQTPANSVASNSLKGEAEPIADNDVVVLPLLTWRKIGRASCRERDVGQQFGGR